ncbi:MAG: hypothetical protein K2Y05_10650 [Hyphomicrobiaceae bacterium]|nr:hypothetical protein [Hyphomicrobiaceae bacterium]
MSGRVLSATYNAMIAVVVAWFTMLTVVPHQPLAEASSTPFALIMVDDPACRFCRKFDAEVGPGYPMTREGRTAPLVKIRRGSPELLALDLAPATYTPTFILVRGRTEIGRITGYPGADFFYEELDTLLERSGSTLFLKPAPSETSSTAPNRGT